MVGTSATLGVQEPKELGTPPGTVFGILKMNPNGIFVVAETSGVK